MQYFDRNRRANKNQAISYRIVTDLRDLPFLIQLAKEAHNESRFSYIEFSPEKVEKIARRALNDPKQKAIMLACNESYPVGFAYCSVGEYHIGRGVLITTIHNINVSQDVRAGLSGGRIALSLFKGIETWSRARGAKEVLLHVTSDVNLARAHKLAKRMGYRFIGGSYVKNTETA